MHITFFIGNGFDINIGLKTRYSEFYPYFCENASEKNMIKNWINEEEKLWADLEQRLGQELHRLSEDELEQFYLDKLEMDTLLIEYLEIEQARFKCDEANKDIFMKELNRSLLNFTNGLTVNDRNSINSTLSSYSLEDYIYSFISFNYTNTLDHIVNKTKEKNSIVTTRNTSLGIRTNSIGNVLHIHGTTNAEMILGVNDSEQVNNGILKEDEDFLDTFIKTRMNTEMGQGKIGGAQGLIKKSAIIFIFGMSIGWTDKFWWEEIVKWLKENSSHKLIISYVGFEKELQKKIPATIIRLKKQLKKDFFEKGKGKYSLQEYEEIKDRIMILYNSKIFNFPKAEKSL